jgi:hypothetical protein
MLLGQCHDYSLAINRGYSTFCLHQCMYIRGGPRIIWPLHWGNQDLLCLLFTPKSNIQWSSFPWLSAEYRNNALPQLNVYEWIEQLKNCLTIITHMSVHSHKWGQHWAYRWHGSVRWVIIDEVANHMQISHGSATKSSTTDLGFIKSVQDGSQMEFTVLHK